MSRGEQHKNLQDVIDAAERIERQFPPSPRPRSFLYFDHFKDKSILKPTEPSSTTKTCYKCGSPNHLRKHCKNTKLEEKPAKKEICNMWNNLSNSPCHMLNGKCKYGRLYQCLYCKKQGCKKILHVADSSPSSKPTHTNTHPQHPHSPLQAHPAQQQPQQQPQQQAASENLCLVCLLFYLSSM